MAQLCPRAEELERLNTQTLIITFSDAYWAQGWLEDTQSPFPLLMDPERRTYRAYGLRRSRWRSWSPRTLWYYYRKKKAGVPLHAIQGDPNQLGGDFIVGTDGRLKLVYPSRVPIDRPPVEMLLEVLRGGAPGV